MTESSVCMTPLPTVRSVFTTLYFLPITNEPSVSTENTSCPPSRLVETYRGCQGEKCCKEEVLLCIYFRQSMISYNSFCSSFVFQYGVQCSRW